MVQYLLKLLEAGLEALDNPASTKAQIVKALKAMQRSLQYGEQVFFNDNHISDASGRCVDGRRFDSRVWHNILLWRFGHEILLLLKDHKTSSSSSLKIPSGRAVSAPDFGSQDHGFESCWRRDSS